MTTPRSIGGTPSGQPRSGWPPGGVAMANQLATRAVGKIGAPPSPWAMGGAKDKDGKFIPRSPGDLTRNPPNRFAGRGLRSIMKAL